MSFPYRFGMKGGGERFVPYVRLWNSSGLSHWPQQVFFLFSVCKVQEPLQFTAQYWFWTIFWCNTGVCDLREYFQMGKIMLLVEPTKCTVVAGSIYICTVDSCILHSIRCSLRQCLIQHARASWLLKSLAFFLETRMSCDVLFCFKSLC